MGLLEIAISQKRDFAAIHFSGDTNPKKLKVHYFLKEEPYSIEKVLECVEYFDGGGTFFEAPLKRAQDIITEHKKFTTADLIFVTDGGIFCLTFKPKICILTHDELLDNKRN